MAPARRQAWPWLEERLDNDAELFALDASDDDGRGTGTGESDAQHWNGWGFADTAFEVSTEGVLRLTGQRYQELFGASRREFPGFADWAETALGIDLDAKIEPLPPPETLLPALADSGPERDSLSALLAALADDAEAEVDVSVAARLAHSHGHSCQEVYALRRVRPLPWGCPDAVVRVSSHAAVERLVAFARTAGNVTLMPVGGRTNVTHALHSATPPSADQTSSPRRCLVAVSLERMNRIKWVDRNNMCASIEAGALGRDIDEKLDKLGLTLGHAPDSSEFSSLGGWVATKSSGMKKNVYGNIEDIVLDVRLVSGSADVGTLQRGSVLERVSTGPDAVRLAVGSEGMLGIVTEVVVRLRLKPAAQRYESYVFADFRHGAAAMREIALQRSAPASVRLLDNTQFRMGQALKPPLPREGTAARLAHDALDGAKQYYVTQYKGFNPDRLCAMVLLFEGPDAAQLRAAEAAVARICGRYGAVRSGPESGLRGYFLTFMIAYLRDFGLDYGFLSESFETTVAWTDVHVVYERVHARIRREAAAEGVKAEPLVGGRVTQTYDSCAAMYFYFGIQQDGLADPVAAFSRIEHAARDEILKAGGSLSHHHGVGKVRKGFLRRPGVSHASERALLRGIKATLDPDDVFANGNIGFDDPEGPTPKAHL